jgi:hypothetical protein
MCIGEELIEQCRRRRRDRAWESKGRTTPRKAKTDAAEAALVLPGTLLVAIGELAGELEEGLARSSSRPGWRWCTR